MVVMLLLKLGWVTETSSGGSDIELSLEGGIGIV